MAHIKNGILLSHKNCKNTSICSNMDGSRDCHNEWSTSDTERHIIWYHFYVESKKKVQIDLYTK